VVALEALKTPGFDKAEVLWLRGMIAGAKVYQERSEVYARHQELEEELMELEKNMRNFAKSRRVMQKMALRGKRGATFGYSRR
jgi:hypothetical protein